LKKSAPDLSELF